jgi:hypothetical protein
MNTGNAKDLFLELDDKERERVADAIRNEDYPENVIRDVVMNFQQRKAKPKVDKGPPANPA